MSLMEGNGLSVADALALQDKNNGEGFGWGGTWIWVFFLFFLLAWGGNGFGFGGANSAAAQGALTRAELNEGLTMNNIERQIQGIQQGLCDGFYSQNTSMLQGFNGVGKDLCSGFNGVQSAIANLGYQTQSCCCETNRSIDAVRYENAKNTCDIINANNANTQRIVDTITQNTIQELRDNLQAAQLQLGNFSQTQTIINTLQPVAKPAYITCSPYASSLPYGYNSGYGYGRSWAHDGCGCN